MAGYSGTPLAKKLGVNTPANYLELIAPLANNVDISPSVRTNVDLWHLFTRSAKELKTELPTAMAQIRQNGMIWVSWPKKSSGESTDVTGDVIRSVALPLGLVDVKVCAVDETWSGLKLVIRKENRQ